MEHIVLKLNLIPLAAMTRPSILSKFFITLSLVFISFNLTAQDIKVTLNINQKSLSNVLDAIEAKTGYSYLVRSYDIDLNELTSINVVNKTLSEVLAQLFENSHVSYEIKGHNISIFKPQNAPENSLSENPIQTINGKIIDEKGEPIIGATILVKGTRFGTVSDLDGFFAFKTASESVLIISHIGYLSVEIKTDNKNNFLIKLVETTNSLDEVVVVAFVSQEKQKMTSSVSQVNAKIIEDKPTANIAAALQGQISGLNIFQSSGQPGQIASIHVRGTGSIESETSPLVIIDGVPSFLSMVSNNDVESISILKDAAACSDYGARAANGVILITTKRGKYGKMTVNYSGYAGFQQPTEIFHEADAYNYANAFNTALMHDAITASTATNPANATFNENRKVFSQTELDNWKSGKVPSTDWRSALFNQNGFTQSHAVSISGGMKRDEIAFKNSLSFSYLQQLGNVVNTDYTRYSVRENGEIKWKKFTAQLSTGFTFSNTNEPTSVAVGDLWQIISAINRQRPVDLIKTVNGDWNITSTNDTRNPIRQASEGGKRSFDNYNVLTNMHLSYEFIRDLKLNYTYGLNFLDNTTDAFKNKLLWNNGTITGPNTSMKSTYRDIHQMQQLDLNFKKSLGDFNLTVLLGAQNEYHTYKYFDAYRLNFVNNSSSSLQLGSLEGSTNNSSYYEWALLGMFGRFDLDFQKKYLFEINFREDISSRLSTGNKTGFFPAVSAGWMLSDEAFMADLKPIISEFKLRASYGILGNQNIPGANYNAMYYPEKSIISATKNNYYVFGNTLINPLSISQDLNTSIGWELTAITDIAVDGKLWNGELTYSLGYFNKETTNMLLTKKVSSVYGGNDYVTNLGAMRNYGFEMEYGLNKSYSNGFAFNLSGNLTYMTNIITDLGGDNLAATGFTRNVVGHPLDSYYLFESNGLLTKDEFINTPANQLLNGQKWGDQKIEDLAGNGISGADGKIDENDKVLTNKTLTPKWFYGFNFNFSYKSFGISGMFQGAADYYRYLGGSIGYGFNNGYSTTQWTIDNSYNPLKDENNYNTQLPRLSILNTINNSYPSSRFLFNSSYIRLKNLQLYYVLSDDYWTKLLNIKSIKIYVTGANLYTLSALPITLGVDPEISSGTSGYPLSRVITFGVNLNF